jgi:DNA invertase Pin-like site-specific DNA recombinase
MLSVFSEFERSMIRERVIAGQQRAVANGVKLGRKTNVNDGIITAVNLTLKIPKKSPYK